MSESAEDAAAKSPGKGGKLITILAVLNFTAVLGLGGYVVYTQQHAAAQSKGGEKAHAEKKASSEHGEAAEGEHGEAAEASDGHGEKAAAGHGEEDIETHGSGPLLALDSMVTNLADPDSDRYLKATIQLRLTSEAAKPEVESNLVPVRNQILIYLSSLTIADVSGADNKRAIQKKVKRLVNDTLPSTRVKQVYFTEFVIQ